MSSVTAGAPLPSHLSRRTFLRTGSFLLAAGFVAGGPGRLLAATQVHKIRLGSAEITVLSDGVFSLPRSIVLPDTPEADAAALLKAHGDAAAAVLQTNVTLVRQGNVLALIDAGAGPDFMPSLGKLGDRLEAAGIASDAVTHVIFTHAHADHFWGVLDPFDDASRFPKARHVMTRAERDFWLQPDAENNVPAFQKGMAAGIQRRLKSMAEVIQVVAPGAEIAPGLALVATPGHTPGHVSVALRSGTEELLVLGDALTHAGVSFQAPQWRWGSDLDPDKAVTTRKSLLDDLAHRKVAVIGYHLPWPGLGRVERQAGAWRFVQG
ncbi:MAG: MBL fold metallo-hydrolase [Hyphomicrobiaceae bacterium]